MWSERSTTAIGSSASGEIRRGRFYPVPVGNDDFWLDRDGVAVMLTGAASEPTSATPYPTVYFKFEINSGWTNFEGGKGKGLVRCVRE